jgi:thymidylate synthase
MWNQRSVDCGLGLPFNIMSYALLTHMIAQCVNMEVDELIFNGGDCHVYENHIEPLKEQMSRHRHLYSLPKIELNSEIKNINDFTYDDIKVIGYESYPTIKMPLSVGL